MRQYLNCCPNNTFVRIWLMDLSQTGPPHPPDLVIRHRTDVLLVTILLYLGFINLDTDIYCHDMNAQYLELKQVVST